MKNHSTKVYRIGEYAIGGIIQVTERASEFIKTYQVQCKDWDTKEIIYDKTCTFVELDSILNDLTSCYYADRIISDFQ